MSEQSKCPVCGMDCYGTHPSCRVRELERQVRELEASNAALKTACDIFEQNSADAVELWELLREVYTADQPLTNELMDRIRDAVYKSKDGAT